MKLTGATFSLATLLVLSGCFSPNEKNDLEESSTGGDPMSDGGTENPMLGTSSGGPPAGESSSAAQSTGETEETGPTSSGTTGDGPSGEDSSSEASGGETTSGSTGAPSECGNSIVEVGEDCDDGMVTPSCSADCTACMPSSPEPLVDQSVGRCLSTSYPDCRNTTSRANGQSNIQAFEAGTEGTLESISLYALNEAVASSNITVQILDGGANALLPSGLTQGEAEDYIVGEAVAPGTTSYGWVDFDFSDQDIEIVPGSHYFIWVRLLPPLPSDSQQFVRWDAYGPNTGTDVYPDGRAFFCPPNQTCDALASAWKFAFRASVTPTPPLCE
jgi:hypothetical protein